MKQGISLVEVLAIIVCVIALVALLFPIRSGPHYLGPREECKRNLGQAGKALHMYVTDHGLRFPGSEGTESWENPHRLNLGGGKEGGKKNSQIPDPNRPLYDYIKDPEAFRCPADRGSDSHDAGVTANVFAAFGNSYMYALSNDLSNGIMGLGDLKLTDPSFDYSTRKIVLYEPPFQGTATRTPSKPDRWHYKDRRSTYAAYLDGHVDKADSMGYTASPTSPAQAATRDYY
ncbi:MAG: hypothetical protein ACI9QL_003416 [Candidatus Omnitrophota bacterium]|jgi:hypothetical protein